MEVQTYKVTLERLGVTRPFPSQKPNFIYENILQHEQTGVATPSRKKRRQSQPSSLDDVNLHSTIMSKNGVFTNPTMPRDSPSRRSSRRSNKRRSRSTPLIDDVSDDEVTADMEGRSIQYSRSSNSHHRNHNQVKTTKARFKV